MQRDGLVDHDPSCVHFVQGTYNN